MRFWPDNPAGSDGRRYDFEYEDDEDEQSGDVDIENKYYNAKQLKTDDAEAAIDEFLGVPALEEEKSDWYGQWSAACRLCADVTTGGSRD